MTTSTLPARSTLAPPGATSLPALIEKENRRRRRRRWWAAGAVVLAVAVGVGVFWARRPRAVPLEARFRTATVTRADLVREVRATGTVDAVSLVSVGAEISGRVATVEVDFNDQVKAGQVLARFDVAALQAQRAQSAALALSAQAQLAQARFDLEQARRNQARSDSLYAQKAISVTEHENVATSTSIAQARVSAAEAAFAAQTALASVAKTNLDHAVIRSPIDGVVITRTIDPGQTVTSMLTTPVLFTIAADLRKMEVLASIDEADISEVRVGQRVDFSVNAWVGRTFTGTVTQVRNAAKVVQDVVTYVAVAEVDNLDFALKPGMTASVRVRTGFAPSVSQVPNGSLSFTPPQETKRDSPHVWVIREGALQALPVHSGLSDSENTALDPNDLPVGTVVLVDLTPEGKKAYGLGAR